MNKNKEFLKEYLKMREGEFVPDLCGQEIRDFFHAHGKLVAFRNDDERKTYNYFNKDDTQCTFGLPQQYKTFLNDAKKSLAEEDYSSSLAYLFLAIKINPTGALGYILTAWALYKLGEYEIAAKELNCAFKYVIDGEVMNLYYKIYMLVEARLGNGMTAAACAASYLQFQKYSLGQSDTEESYEFIRENGIDINDAKNRVKEILVAADIPYITLAELTQRRMEYGIIDGRAADIYSAIVDGNTHNVITDKNKMELYDNLPVIAFESDNINEALNYAKKCGTGIHIGLKPHDGSQTQTKEPNESEKYEETYDSLLKNGHIDELTLNSWGEGILRQVNAGECTEAEQRLISMFKHIKTNELASTFYMLYSCIETYRENPITANACVFMSLEFADEGKIDINDIKNLLLECNTDFNYIRENRECIIKDAGIPLLTCEKLFNKPPCEKCPYKLGQVRTPVSPCPQCKLDNYSAYERFLSMRLNQAPANKPNDENI